MALRFTAELSGTGLTDISRILGVGQRGQALRFAALVLTARRRSARQARSLLARVGKARAGKAQ